jgi:type I restriction enzyme, S subunit
MSEWRDVTLDEISERVDYGYTASALDDPTLPRFLRITDIAQTHLDWSSVPGCPIDERNLDKYKLAADDIVVARTGATVGYAKRIRTHPQSVFASYLVRFRLGAEANPSFVGAIVESNDYKQWVRQNAGGAAQPNASAKVLGAYPLRLPDLTTQERVGAIFDAIADLIENNRRRVEVLQEMARAIYREWFVEFRYPGHEDVPLVDSALGPVPGGWTVERVDSHLVLQRGFDLPVKDRATGPIAVMGASGVQGSHDVAKVSGPGVTTGRSGTVGKVNYVPEDFWPLNTSLWVKEFRLATPRYAYFLLGDLDLRRSASGAAVPTLDRKVVHALPAVCPPANLIAQWDAVVLPMFEEGELLRRQLTSLTAVRDLLLPRLVSGKIDVSTLDVDALAEGAVA